jgi:hypothetical protein
MVRNADALQYIKWFAQPAVQQKWWELGGYPVRGLSDRAVAAWLFITPTMLVLLAINVFPLIWTIRLSCRRAGTTR